MKSRSATDLQDPSLPWDGGYPNYWLSSGEAGGNPVADAHIGVMATVSSSVPSTVASTAGTLVVVTSGGITFDLLFDAAAPTSFRAGIQQAASILAATISDKITVNLNIHYSGTGGGAFAGPDNGFYESYASIRSDLINNAAPGDTIFNALPSRSSIQGQSNIAVWNAELKLWGFLGANDTTTDDGGATFATDINPNLLVGVALHELTHALGRVPFGPAPDIFDLFRFTSAGVRLFQGGNTAPASYFSVDGGITKLADFGQNSDPSDFLNSGVQGTNDPFNEFYNSSTSQILSTVDKQLLDVLGFHTTAPIAATAVVEAFGSTHLTQVGNNYFLLDSTGSGPSLKYLGATIVVGQWGAAVVPIGAEVTASGYEVAWKLAADSYTVWNTDSNGNDTTNTIGIVSGSSTALKSLETSFHQDLNGDGVIGIPATMIEAFGSTHLTQVGNNYFLLDSTGSGPSLKYLGANIVAGQWGAAIVPIGAEATATGYEVAWKLGANSYTVWNTDSNGNDTTNTIGIVSGSSTALKSLEASFQQDLNGDGVIGIPATVIESFGSTRLTQVGNNYFLLDSTGSGPSLKYLGANIVAGQWGATIVPIGAEVTATGYQVAWKLGANSYTVWNTDINGNDTTNTIGIVSGTSTALESLETSFHQDVNGDGVIGVPAPQALGVAPSNTVSQTHSEAQATDPVVSALNQQLALWSQHMASAFPTSAFGGGGLSIVGASEWGDGQLSQLAKSVTNQQSSLTG